MRRPFEPCMIVLQPTAPSAGTPQRGGLGWRAETTVPCREAGRLSHELAGVEYIEYHLLARASDSLAPHTAALI